MPGTNGHTNGTTGVHTNGTTAADTDYGIDTLYSWWPGQAPAAPACPEASFSLTLKGTLDGIEALFTVRGQTPAEFKAHLAAVRGLLDQPQAPPTVLALESWCAIHAVKMTQQHKNGQSWYSHKLGDGWCKGKQGR